MTIESFGSGIDEVIKDLFGPDFVSIEHFGGAGPDRGIDALLTLQVGRRRIVAALELKSSLLPSLVPSIAHQLKKLAECKNFPAILVTSSVSERAAEICREYGLNWIDLAGNADIALPGLRLNIRGRAPVKVARKDKGSLFTHKTSQIIHALLSHPGRSWTTTSLADTSQVSHGLVVRARKLLEDQGYAEARHGSLALSEPLALLQDWKKQFRSGRTSLQTYSLERQAQILRKLGGLNTKVLLAEYTAGQEFASYASPSYLSLYCQDGLNETAELIGAKQVESGGNVLLYRDDAAWQFFEQKGPYLCTSLVRTILDLSVLKGRAVDAADHLIEAEFLPRWKK